MRTLLLWVVVLVETSCSFLPGSGPLQNIVDPGGSARANVAYEIFDVDARTIRALDLYRPPSLLARFGNKSPPPRQAVGIGDQVVVNIWEASSGGLFSGTAGQVGTAKGTTLPPQTIDQDGDISVPYAGRIRAAGRTPVAISEDITARLKDKAVEPQVIVSVAQTIAATATVVGDATTGGRITLSIKGDRLLEVIAQSGGIKYLPHEVVIRLSRRGVSEVVSMNTILTNPQENVYIYPGDTIYVLRDPQTFTALGAVATQKDHSIDKERLAVAAAVAKAGGLIDLQADAGGVFLFRFEQPQIVQALNPQSRFLVDGKTIPVVYRINLRKPEDYFHTQEIAVRNNDLIYVANASSVEFMKFLNVVRGVVLTVRGAVTQPVFAN